jgi:hypothetical protein
MTHMARSRKNEYRDPITKRYAYFGGFDRICKCGHRLGDHIAGGFECGITKEAEGCACQKFRPQEYKRPRAREALGK